MKLIGFTGEWSWYKKDLLFTHETLPDPIHYDLSLGVTPIPGGLVWSPVRVMGINVNVRLGFPLGLSACVRGGGDWGVWDLCSDKEVIASRMEHSHHFVNPAETLVHFINTVWTKAIDVTEGMQRIFNFRGERTCEGS